MRAVIDTNVLVSAVINPHGPPAGVVAGVEAVARERQRNRGEIVREALQRTGRMALGVPPLDDEFFDVVTMLAVLEHIAPEHLPAVLSQIHRVLKNGGLFIITTPAPWSHGLLRVMARLRLVSLLEIEEHKACYRAGAISTLLMASGFLAENIRFGYFELGMNLWLTATK